VNEPPLGVGQRFADGEIPLSVFAVDLDVLVGPLGRGANARERSDDERTLAERCWNAIALLRNSNDRVVIGSATSFRVGSPLARYSKTVVWTS
jgi:hypothetical protein